MQARVLILLQTQNYFVDLIKLNLEHNNYIVEVIPKTFKLNFLSKVINLITFPFFKNKSYLSIQKKRFYAKNKIADVINFKKIKGEKFDYTIVFRADQYEDNILIDLKKISKKTIAFHWDGLERYPKIFSKIDLFDSFYTFNPEDALQYNLKFISNFYFDYIQIPKMKKDKWAITYIGYYSSDRLELLTKIQESFPNLRLNFSLKSFNAEDRLKINQSNVKSLEKSYSYFDLLKIHNASSVILDIKTDVHNGLSLRFFEAIQLDKKIITTNRHIKEYDFYNENNILVLDDSLEDINDFLTKPFLNYPNQFKEKYSFTNWFKNIIDEEKYIVINNPITIP